MSRRQSPKGSSREVSNLQLQQGGVEMLANLA
eukprot:CAMPEP_0206492014 /NCGR_PEP_ID=MMETSP0324_2-20121206/45617_1 /ASSEMBLY_ACC=CAM_ASM_000836 /TAXON_ID=2866 /ORGANISM="Crypthecodinium cohnii, Strain Seligo" /LENGTH=31 /DNA_ID= /DNA_START= /DNA_END= /DNA_ORIENTATION=